MEPTSNFISAPSRRASATPLRNALDELGISTLSPAEVEAYRRSKMAEVLDRHRPRFSKKLKKPVDDIQKFQAHAWARENRMRDFDVRYYLGLFGIGVPISHVVGWTVKENLPDNAPEHVAEKTRQILARLPQARIETEILIDEHRVYDPIVSVHLGAERYVFEVYDEPVLETSMF